MIWRGKKIKLVGLPEGSVNVYVASKRKEKERERMAAWFLNLSLSRVLENLSPTSGNRSPTLLNGTKLGKAGTAYFCCWLSAQSSW